MELQKKFLKDAEKVAFDPEHRRKLNHNISKYQVNVEKGKKQFNDLELARKKAANTRHKILNDLDKYLIEFESNFEKNGGKVIWASTAKDAVKEIMAIMKNTKAVSVVKSKSMMTEELELNEILEKKKIEAIETDLGEFIVQLAGEKPYHILTPAMHKSKEDVAKLYHEKFGMPLDSTPAAIAAYTRNYLREKFLSAGVGITGANFLLSDLGAVCLTENEGNGLMSISFPKVHIVIAGIEKILPSISDLQLFWPLLATMGTGQKVTAYNSIVFGPRHEDEADGPAEMYVVLLDNRRTEVLKQEKVRRALSCIRCGACLNACPVYKNIGGYTYSSVYTGPIGSVITPWMEDMGEYKHLSFASSLCGNCTDVCPVHIPLHELLLVNRQKSVEMGYAKSGEKFMMKNMKRVLLSRKLMNMRGGFKNMLFRNFFASAWGPRRELPRLEAKTFNKLWREKQERLMKEES
ncbi:MAG TPA: lactate utilization protein B [Bacteroidales bacterium]|nr:lactate utilization protein B [Bacteroidales bacterium]HPI86907.1 lactate utilization protein B [Bacteroidales bacterium]HPM93108.1 lactate utilization protein B [Bacteroidales bacterium]